MTAEDTEHRDDESTETEGSDHERSDGEGTDHESTGTAGTDRTEQADGSADDSDHTGSTHERRGDSDGAHDSDERVKERDRYDDDTAGVTDARPGRSDIGEAQMPSDYHEAVAQRPVEVNLPDTPDLSEDAEGGSGSSADRE